MRSIPRRNIFYLISHSLLCISPCGSSRFLPFRRGSLLIIDASKAPLRWCKYLLPGLYFAYTATIPVAPLLSKPPSPSSSPSDAKESESTPPTTQNEASHCSPPTTSRRSDHLHRPVTTTKMFPGNFYSPFLVLASRQFSPGLSTRS